MDGTQCFLLTLKRCMKLFNPGFFSGQNGFGDYQEQPQLNYPQYSDQEFSYQQYQEYSDQNEVFNQYGPGQSFLKSTKFIKFRIF